MTDGTVPESEHDQQKNAQASRTESVEGEAVGPKADADSSDEALPVEPDMRDHGPANDAATSDGLRVSEPQLPVTSNPEPPPLDSSVPISEKPKPETAPEESTAEAPKKRRVNPFSEATQFFSLRGFVAACSLFLMTLSACLRST